MPDIQPKASAAPEQINPPASNLARVSARELASAVTSKKDIYDALTVKGRLFLMPVRNCTMNFLKQVL